MPYGWLRRLGRAVAPSPPFCIGAAARFSHAQLRGQTSIAKVAPNRRRRSAGASAADDPARFGMCFPAQLANDRLRDVVVAAPIRGPRGQTELIQMTSSCGRVRGCASAFLNHVPDPPAQLDRIPIPRRLSQNDDRTIVRLGQTIDEAKRRGLAGTRGAEQRQNRTFLDRDRHPIEHERPPAEALGHGLQVDERGHVADLTYRRFFSRAETCALPPAKDRVALGPQPAPPTPSLRRPWTRLACCRERSALE